MALIAFCGASYVLGQAGLPADIFAPPDSVHFGRTVASGGDATGDGVDDIFVMDEEFVDGGTNHRVGRWYLYSGDDRTLVWMGTGDRQSETVQATFFIGAFVGDINNDGFDDILLGRPDVDDQRGIVNLLSGIDGQSLREWTGAAPGDRLGRDVTGVGDVNHDGSPDLGMVARSTEDGLVSIRSGLDGSELHQFSQSWPRRVRGAGDIDRDGFDDLVIGSTYPSQNRDVYVRSGRTGDVIHILHRPGTYDDWFGYALAAGVDVDGDNVPDIATSGQLYGSGHAYLWSGATGDVIRIYTAHDNDWSPFGFGLYFGDTKADGQPDLYVSAVLVTRVFDAMSGISMGKYATSYPFVSFVIGDETAVGDFNRDGATDIVTGAFVVMDQRQVEVHGGGSMLLSFDDSQGEFSNFVHRQGRIKLQAQSDLPGRRVYLLASREGNGCTFVGRLGICIDLDQPILLVGSAVTDGSHAARYAFAIPRRMPLGYAWLQAVDPTHPIHGPITSNVMRLVITN